MKFARILIMLMLCTAGFPAIAQKLQMTISPQPMIVNEPAQLELKYHGNRPARLDKLPDIDGLQFSSSSPSIRQMSINGVFSFSSIYSVTATKSGKIDIPALSVSVGPVKLETEPVKVVAVKRQIIISDGGNKLQKELGELLYGKVRIIPDKQTLYVGEEVSAIIDIYSLKGLELELSYPVLDVKNVVVKDFRNLHRRGSDVKDFEPARQTQERQDNLVFNVYRFRTSFRPIATGVLKGKATVNTAVLFPAKRNSRSSSRRRFGSFFDDDDFLFSDPFNRRSQYDRVPRKIVLQFPQLEIQSLPKCPVGVTYLGLVGDWQLNTYLSTEDFKVGNHFTLHVDVQGRGTMDTLKVPELKAPGFNVYPAEVDKSSSADGRTEKASIKFVMIPLDRGPVNLDLNFAVFDATAGTYKEFPFHKVLKVAKSDNPNAAPPAYVPYKSRNSSNGYKPSKEARKIDEIFYLKKGINGKIQLPLWKNELVWYLILLCLGPLVLIIKEFRFRHSVRLENDPLLARKRQALARRSRVLKALKACTDDDLTDIAQKELVPFLNDLLGENPGTTATELAGKVDEKELHDCLHEISVNSFMPGSGEMDKTTLRKALIKVVKRLSIVMLLISALFFGGAVDAKIVDISKEIKTSQEAINAYNDGNFKDAAMFYRKQIDPDDPSPNALYNLGNCFYQMGNLPRALVAYERALRLSPRDTDILENLNLTRRKLFLPEIRKAEDPLQLLKNFRDSFRPDQWFLAVMICWSLGFLVVALRRGLLKGKRWRYMLASICIIGALCLVAAVSQYSSTYSANTAIVVINNAPVYSLPTIKNGRVTFKLKAGEVVQVEETLDDWLRIRDDKQTEGWVKRDAISSLWQHE